jgi:hypothetical protein
MDTRMDTKKRGEATRLSPKLHIFLHSHMDEGAVDCICLINFGQSSDISQHLRGVPTLDAEVHSLSPLMQRV